MIENLAIRRFTSCVQEDFIIQNNRKATRPEVIDIMEASGMALASGLPKPDNIVIKNGAGEIRKLQIEAIKKTIFRKKPKHF